MPFLALPDGAHLSEEDYSYFHIVPSTEGASTVFGISCVTLFPCSLNAPNQPNLRCNRQIAASDLLVKTGDITRSTVQKAVVVLASKPIFGPIRLAGIPTGLYTPRSLRLLRRDKLGVVTRAFFNQRDFGETDILVQFYERLETSARTQLTESGLYMGMS